MRCSNCGKKMAEDAVRCPHCQKKVEKKEKTELTENVLIWKIIAAVAVCAMLLVLLTYAVYCSIKEVPMFRFGKKSTETTGVAAVPTEPKGDSTTPTAPLLPGTAEDLGMSIEGITDIGSYLITGEVTPEVADRVIVQIGDYALTNSLLQVFYRMALNEFASNAVSQGQDLKTTFNLDTTKPMNEQVIIFNGTKYDVTWEQYLLHSALSNWLKYVTANIMADEAGYVLSDTDRASLVEVPAKLEEEALKEGFASVEEFVDDRVGVMADLEDYVAYMELTARGDMYYAYFIENYAPSEEEVKEFFELNADYYGYYGITAELGKVADVRHILLMPEGEKDDYGNPIATDEQWEACRVKAQEILDTWKAGDGTEKGFADLANDHSDDGGSNTKGGLYENVYTGQMVKEFNDWVFDPARVSGDSGLVKTNYGYHIMYFVSLSEHDAWYEYAYSDAKSSGYGFNMMLGQKMEESAFEPMLDGVALNDLSRQPVAE